jgi:hypothetical protein
VSSPLVSEGGVRRTASESFYGRQQILAEPITPASAEDEQRARVRLAEYLVPAVCPEDFDPSRDVSAAANRDLKVALEMVGLG